MKIITITLLLLLLWANVSISQEWMTNLEFAKKLALDQNKFLLMVWEDATYNTYSVYVSDANKRSRFVKHLFADKAVNKLIWNYFVPVIVSESLYDEWYEQIKHTRSQHYKNVFNDDSIKVIDANGIIINLKQPLDDFQNISKIISRYGVNTSYISTELRAYKSKKEFYSVYYLASKYQDLAMFQPKATREALLTLAHLYSDEAMIYAQSAPENAELYKQRCQLLQVQERLLLKRPNQALRQLKRLQKEGIDTANNSQYAFLMYSAYMASGELELAELWKSKLSSVNLKKAQLVINLNKN